MYAVVGCNNCSNLWLLSDADTAQTANCSRCGKTHQTKKLRRFFESEDHAEARQARAAILAGKQGANEEFQKVDSVAEMERQLDDAGIDDRAYLERSGFDADTVDEISAAGDVSRSSSRSRRDVVTDALREQERPTEDDVVAYATEHGVPAEAVRDLLEKLRRRGEVSESRGRYRLL
jgi:DNA-directed RNA polymerase subunit M/transcription elongation factor TFIIS